MTELPLPSPPVSGVRSLTSPRILVAALALLLLTLGAYSTVGQNQFLAIDDGDYVTENPMVYRGLTAEGARWALTALHSANWHPLTWLSLMLDVQLFGTSAAALHYVNLALHVANALLLFALLVLATGALWRSLLVAALFAVHPLHVESVAWIAERKDLLSTLLALLTLLAWLRHLRRPQVGWHAAAVVLFALALTAKPMPVTLPFLLLVLDWWPLGRWRPGAAAPGQPRRIFPDGALWLEKLPFFALAAASAWVTFIAQARSGAVSSQAVVPVNLRIVNAVSSYLRYLQNAVWPADLSFYYAYKTHFEPLPLALAVAVLVGGSFLALRLAARRPWLCAGWLWYVGTLVPVIGLVQVGAQSMADRYTYFPLTGVLIAVAWELRSLATRAPQLLRGLAALSVGAVLVLIPLTRTQVAVWRTSDTLVERALAREPDNWMAHWVLGIARMQQGRPKEALEHYEIAFKGNPSAQLHMHLGLAKEASDDLEGALGNYTDAILLSPNFGEAYSNLGALLLKQGKNAEAVAVLRQSVRFKPLLASAHVTLADALAQTGDVDGARQEYLAALRLSPDPTPLLNKLGILEVGAGRYEAALDWLRQILAANPDNVSALQNVGNVLQESGRVPEAIAVYEDVLRRDPGLAEAHYNLANALLGQGRREEARQHYTAFLEAQPDHAQGRIALGNLLAEQGQYAQAAEQYQRALAGDPGNPDAHLNLGSVLATAGSYAAAAPHFAEAARLQPGDPLSRSRLGDMQARLGRVAEARASYQEALARDPASEELREKVRQLGGTSTAP